ncbi:MAG: TrmH family RNA methyltransferase [Bacteroidales bacterium]
MTVPDLCFILYKPAVPGNIGASARAIKTMGFRELRLIDPADHLSDEAKMMAHGSHDILENCKVFDTYDEAVTDISFVICTTAKKRSAKVDYIPAPQLAQFIVAKSDVTGKIAIVFGSEESGLPNNILLKANVGVTIPMATGYPSLNLSQAVMTIAYECSTGAERIRSADEKYESLAKPSAPSAGKKPLSGEEKIEKKLAEEIELSDEKKDAIKSKNSLDPESQRQSHETWKELQERTSVILQEAGIHPPTPLYHRIIERMSMMKASDARLVHSVTSRIIKLLRNSN